MKIAFDIRPVHFKGTGIGIYTKKIFEELKKRNIEDYLFLDGPVNLNNTLKEKIFFNLWEQLKLPFTLKRAKAKIYHSTKNVGIPLFKTCKYIITIHDVIPYVFPKQYYPNKLKWLIYRFKTRISIMNSDVIITISNYSKNDIVKYLKVPPGKIKVIYLGFDNENDKPNIEEINKVREKFGIKNRYLLGIGGNEYRKNVGTLIKAYLELKDEKQIDMQLVVVGKPWNSSKYPGGETGIVYTDYVTNEELLALYSGAEVFVFPSLYEGFGLPPLEAMACETPVIASNVSSIPEIVGDAAILVDPSDIQAIKNSIYCLYDNEDLKKKLIQKGLDRIKLFSWAETVNELEQVYRTLLQDDGDNFENRF